MVKEKGAKSVFIAATHGLFCGAAMERLAGAEVEKIVVTDSVKPLQEYPKNIEVLSIAPLLAEAIVRIHDCQSVSSLFVD